VEDARGALCGPRDGVGVADVALDDLDPVSSVAEVRLLRSGVEHDDLGFFCEKALDDERPDEPGAAGDEETLARDLHDARSY
jgi:hypothetical protein